MSELEEEELSLNWRRKIAGIGKASISKLFINSFRQFNSRMVSIAPKNPVAQCEYYENEQFCSSGMLLETENFLYGNLLWEKLEKEPLGVLKKIRDFYEISQNPVYWLISSDVCRYLAKKSGVDESIKYYLSAYYFDYQCLASWRKQSGLEDFSSSHFIVSCAVKMFNETIAGIFRFLKNRGLLNVRGFVMHGVDGQKFFIQETTFDLSVPPEAVTDYSLCSDFSFSGLRMNNRHRGMGAPLVATLSNCELSNTLYNPGCLTIPVTLLIQPNQQPNGDMGLHLIFADTLKSESVVIAGNRMLPGEWMLSRDYTTPIACFLNSIKARNLLGMMLHTDTQEKRTGLCMVEPYDPAKIPVVFVHGLLSSPETWGEMFNSLKADGSIRKKYQFWFFLYSTGCPVFFSAARLRKALLDAQKEYCTTPEAAANFNKMVIVGHSMGGMLTRCILPQDPWYYLKLITGKSMEEVRKKLSAEDQKVLEDNMQLAHLPFVKRVVFMAVPHRGSGMAEYWIAKLGVRLTRLSGKQLKTLDDIRRILNTLVPGRKVRPQDQFMTGISNLNPNNVFVKALGESPLRDDVVYHSVIGNNRQEGVPGGTDGVVPYASSHIEKAVSECIVKSGHSVHQQPSAIYEIMRILLLHLKETV